MSKKIVINADAFKGLVQFNGQSATEEVDKGTGKVVVGATGMHRFALKGAGSVYLSEEQYTVVV